MCRKLSVLFLLPEFVSHARPGYHVKRKVTDGDVFRQLVLNRLTADNDGGAGAQRSAGASFKPSGRGPPSFLGRSYPVGGSSIRGRDGEGERGWGWQARQTQLALWIEEAIRCDNAEREVGR